MRLLALVFAVAVVGVVARSAAADPPRPLYYDRALTPADLQGRTLRELAIMRNTIYAHAGHPFRKKWLHDYFAAQPWYKPLAKDDDSKITKLDRANAVAIAQAEQNQKRPDLMKRRDDVIELGILNTRLGEWAAAASDAKPPSDASPLEDPSQLDHVLRVEQLSNLS